MAKFFFILISICLLIASPVSSFQKCVNEKGEMAFTDTNCPQGYKPVKQYEEAQQREEPKHSSTAQMPEGKIDSNAREILNKVKLSVIDRKQISIESDYYKPKDGNIYLGFLIQVENGNEDVTIHGGSGDHSNDFSLKTSDGYTTNALNISAQLWKKVIKVYTGKDLYPREDNKGWIVFEVAKNAMPKKNYI